MPSSVTDPLAKSVASIQKIKMLSMRGSGSSLEKSDMEKSGLDMTATLCRQQFPPKPRVREDIGNTENE